MSSGRVTAVQERDLYQRVVRLVLVERAVDLASLRRPSPTEAHLRKKTQQDRQGGVTQNIGSAGMVAGRDITANVTVGQFLQVLQRQSESAILRP